MLFRVPEMADEEVVLVIGEAVINWKENVSL